jgi:hypothetical protein
LMSQCAPYLSDEPMVTFVVNARKA